MTKALDRLTEAEINGSAHMSQDSGFGALRTEKGPLPLKAMDVRAKIDGLIVRTDVRQTFVNTNGEPLEATYIFPLPDRAAVVSFRLEVAGRIVEGVLKEREEARREYDEAIQRGHRAAIAEEERPNVFTMRVGNILPGEIATVQLALAGPLAARDGEAEFRFPLVVAPRYIPGVPLDGAPAGDGVMPDTDAVPDGSRITPPVLLPGFPNPVHLSFEVELNPAGLPVSDIRSSLHAVIVSPVDSNVHSIRLEAGERLNRDFILRFRIADSALRTSLLLEPDSNSSGKSGEEGAFLLTIVPPASSSRAVRPRDLVFILDRSGSMEGWKMAAARRAIERMVETLGDSDRFNVYAFDNLMETPAGFDEEALLPGTAANRAAAARFLSRIDARGGTGLAGPLLSALETLEENRKANDRERILVLVTDGQVGNEDQILREASNGLRDVRVYALGIDRAVNEGFLRRLASAGGGGFELVESEERLSECMDRIHLLIAAPVLTGISLSASGFETIEEEVSPARIPALFEGVPLLVHGRFRGSARGMITITGKDASGRGWTERVRSAAGTSGAATPIWARARIRDLEDRYASTIPHHERQQIEKTIVTTSLRFSVLSRFTAYVAVDRSEAANRDGTMHRILQPVEAPEGWDMLADTGAFHAYSPASASSPMPTDGTVFRAAPMGAFERDESGVRRSLHRVADVQSPWKSIAAMLWHGRGSPRVALRRFIRCLERLLEEMRLWEIAAAQIQRIEELLTESRDLEKRRSIKKKEVEDLRQKLERTLGIHSSTGSIPAVE
ncbi:MAG TPA: VIT domain-containing protein [Planctomycetota bacterium]|nr:VIT domain-containing protein [Planctomycetota bacterium]